MTRFCLFISALILVTNALSQDVGSRLTDAKVDQGNSPQIQSNRVKAAPFANSGVRSLLDDSEALPPEFAADAILQLVENGFIRSDGLKIKVLSRAFEKASAAQDDVMRHPWGASVEETTQGLHAIASFVTRLDRISLQTRVVRQLSLINPRRARQVFESMRPPYIEPASCNDNSYFVPDSYYDALAVVVEHGFSDREITGGLRADYVNSAIKTIQSHVQLLPVAQLLNTGNFTEQELREIVPAYAASLGDLHGDALSFGVLMSRSDRLLEAIAKLIALLDKDNIDSLSLLRSLREYLVLNFKGPSCATALTSRDSGSTLPDAVSQFNQRFAGTLVRSNLGLIRESEIKTNKKESVENPPPSRWRSQTYSQLLVSLQKLNLPENQRAPTAAQSDSDWSSQAGDLLAQLADWSDASEPEAEFFHQKAILMEGLAEKSIGTSIHARALDRFIRFLEQHSYQQVSAVDWFLYAKKLLAASVRPGSLNEDLGVFLDSREPVLSIYARLELLQQQSVTNEPSGVPNSRSQNKPDHK
jgi:hypothetical protein